MSKRPKPCPFCGYQMSVEQYRYSLLHEEDGNRLSVGCTNCGAAGPLGSERTARQKWNRRADKAKDAIVQ